ncbi:kinesin-like protein KIN-5D [Cynara cardunculus var. scolymus]|uniref:kinesin-like protein KIN-5D n=1 Tax=Cynara cardunculus var. scolymus TaxID=59895 RepID=UPI000D624F62|nr:kinesin-like protein KIN-5D [Cynara cardunculus var. scolymus]
MGGNQDDCSFVLNSETALSNINSEAVKHSSALAELIREASVKVGDILDDLQSNLNDQEQSIAAFWQQQHESRLRAYETTQSASSVTVNFFKTLSKDIFVVIQMVEEARTMYYKKLSEFTKKFEDYADSEDRQLLAKMAELLASSNAKKKQLVQTEVNDIQSYIGSKTYMLHHKVSDMHGFLSSTEDEYTSFLEKTKKHYIEDKIVTQNGQDGLTAILQNCDALETKQAINTQLSSLASSTVEEIDIAQSSSLPSVECKLFVI